MHHMELPCAQISYCNFSEPQLIQTNGVAGLEFMFDNKVSLLYYYHHHINNSIHFNFIILQEEIQSFK